MNTSVNEPVESYALFVGSLSAGTTQEHLVHYFSMFGSIQGANLITDWATGASKRCAIVFCSEENTSKRVLQQKNHKLDGKIIRVSLADQDKKGTKKISTTNLFVGNIAEKCSEQEIRLLFNKFGQIDSIRFFKNASTKPNTKNAIIQYVDSKSVELAFKSKSEMGTTDDSLKISPLKQKKAPGNHHEVMEDMASMVMQMCSQGFEGAGQSMGLDIKNFQFGQQMTSGSFSEIEPGFPSAVRRHRKSSSVDVLPAPKINPTEYPNSEIYSCFGQVPFVPIKMNKLTSQGTNRPSKQISSQQLKLQANTHYTEPNFLAAKPSHLCDTSQQQEPKDETFKNNFITLIDLFNDEEDNLSFSFYGVSPMRKSRTAKSTTKSRLAFGDSSSECPEEDHSTPGSD